MKHISILVLLMLGVLCCAEARLDETAEESDKRYGPPKEQGKFNEIGLSARKYSKDGVEISAALFDGKTVMMVYTRQGKFSLALSSTQFSKEEVNTLLQVESRGSEWQEIPLTEFTNLTSNMLGLGSGALRTLDAKAVGKVFWKRKDGNAFACRLRESRNNSSDDRCMIISAQLISQFKKDGPKVLPGF
ncbi:MAG: hypothetical protein A2107_12360 [Verrucomicrobia bacterium GWF2_62_7]|nr:MAG: hypothetical protein A2107_12360 [Verrucomicrobia bacterium GWF2_62_7]